MKINIGDMATPNNFKITNSIGTTDNFAGPEVQFFYITLITADGSSVLDVRTELGYDETLHNLQRTILQRGTILYQRVEMNFVVLILVVMMF